MQNPDMFSAATAPVTFHDFLQRMRHPSAADLVRSIKSFIVSFSNNAPDPEVDSKSVQDFYISMEEAFRSHPLWAGATEDEIDSASEGLEKYLMTKLFNQAFAIPEDARKDDELSEKMSLVQQFLRPEHLDIHPNFQNETSWLIAQKELQKINTYKSPRDKLSCILNYCKVINNLLFNVAMATKENPPGADIFLPVLIYVSIKANPPRFHSNLMYIQRYRRQSRLVAEAAYFFTNLVSAESFILNMDATSLSMDESEFRKRMDEAKLVVNSCSNVVKDPMKHSNVSLAQPISVPSSTSAQMQKQTQKESLDGGKESQIAMDENLSHSSTKSKLPPSRKIYRSENVKSNNTGAKMTVQKLEEIGMDAVLHADRTGQLTREYPFLYADYSDLRIEDVEALLTSYKELVLKYASLSKGVESSLEDAFKMAESYIHPKQVEFGVEITGEDQKGDHSPADSNLDAINAGNEGSEVNKSNISTKNLNESFCSDTALHHLEKMVSNISFEIKSPSNEESKDKSSNLGSGLIKDATQLETETFQSGSMSTDLSNAIDDVLMSDGLQASLLEKDVNNLHDNSAGSNEENLNVSCSSEELNSGSVLAKSDEQGNGSNAELIHSETISSKEDSEERM